MGSVWLTSNQQYNMSSVKSKDMNNMWSKNKRDRRKIK